MSDELIDDLTIECYCDGEGKCYRCRAADEITRLRAALAMWEQVWDNVKLANPDLRSEFTVADLEACFRAVAEREREECEKLVVAIRNDWNDDDQILKAVAADYLAEAIRARGQR